MAIAPTKLGLLVASTWHVHDVGGDGVLIQRLRGAALVRAEILDDAIRDVLAAARIEHQALAHGVRGFNSPHERVRVFLAPYLTRKGGRWAEPFTSLQPWWQFWR